MKLIRKTIFSLTVLLSCYHASAQSQVFQISTPTTGTPGQNATNWTVQTPNSTVFNNAIVTNNDWITTMGQIGPYSATGANLCEGSWIASSTSVNGEASPVPPGFYRYRTTFNFQPGSSCGGTVSGQLDMTYVSGDNRISSISVNGTSYNVGPYVYPLAGAFSISVPIIQGINTITFNVQNFAGGSNPNAFKACGTIEVNELGYWHKTTKDAFRADQVNDLVTDPVGNVYVAGKYVGETTLDGGSQPDFTISANGNGRIEAFIAAYDACGSLLWTVNASDPGGINSGGSEAHAITYSDNYGIVYVTGTCNSDPMQFNSLCSGPIIDNSSKSGFVITIDASTGCILSFFKVVLGHSTTQFKGIALNHVGYTNSNNFTWPSSLYIGGNIGSYFASSNSNSGDVRSIFYRYTLDQTTGIPDPALFTHAKDMTQKFGNDFSRIVDLDYDNAKSRLVLIGEYNTDFSLVDLSSNWTLIYNMWLISSPVVSETFVMSIDDIDGGGMFQQDWWMDGQCQPNGTIRAGGVSVDQSSSDIYFTGSYKESTGFNTFASLTSLPSNSNTSAYICKMANPPVNSSIWIDYAQSNNGDVNGVDVVEDNGRGHFIGTFTENNVVFNAGPPSQPYTNTTNSGSLPHTYIATYDIFGNGLSSNATKDPLSNSEHIAKAVTVDRSSSTGGVFLGGYYSNEMDYVASGGYAPLLSLSNLAGNVMTHSAFILKGVATHNSATFIPVLPLDDNLMSDDHAGALFLFPNPTNDFASFVIDDFSAESTYEVSLYSVEGKRIKTIIPNNFKVLVDISELSSGIYTVVLTSSNNQQMTGKIVKN